MNVYVVEYGCVDLEDESLFGVFKLKADALAAAISSATEGVEEMEDDEYRLDNNDEGTVIYYGSEVVEWYRVTSKTVQ